jgi:hypothetical protein
VMGAVKLGLLVNRALPSLKIGKFVLWAAIFGFTHTLAVFLLLLINTHSVPVNPEFLMMNARIGALMGAGVGLGLEVATSVRPDWTVYKNRHKPRNSKSP